MREVGSLTIKLDYEMHRVQGVRLCAPRLGIDEHLTKLSRFDSIPSGTYDATLIIHLTNGGEAKQNIKLKILPDQDNVHQFDLAALEQEIYLRPVDAKDRTLLAAEIKIENVDLNFRPVRDWRGLPCKLRPGEYQVKVILPNLQMKTLSLRVVGGVTSYTLPAQEKPIGTRREPRIPLSIQVDYKTNEGFWISTKSVNLSSTGVCVLKKPLSMESKDTSVRLFLPTGLVECPARICWERENQSPQMGVELFPTRTMKEFLGGWLANQPH